MIAYVTAEDMDRWISQGRSDILHIIENEQAFWAGDHLLSARDGRPLMGCPFLTWKRADMPAASTRPDLVFAETMSLPLRRSAHYGNLKLGFAIKKSKNLIRKNPQSCSLYGMLIFSVLKAARLRIFTDLI